MIVGRQLAVHVRAELVLDALEMAAALRQPAAGLIAHSNRGSQYTSLLYTDRLDELGIAPSVGSVGHAYDNAMAQALGDPAPIAIERSPGGRRAIWHPPGMATGKRTSV